MMPIIAILVLFNQNFLRQISILGILLKIWDTRVAPSMYTSTDAKTSGTFERMDAYVINGDRVRAAILVASCVRYISYFVLFFLLLSPLPLFSLFFSFFLLSSLFTCNTSVRNRVALNESVGVYRSWQYFKSALSRQMQRVGQVRPGIHLNSLLRHIWTMPRPLDCHRHLLHRLVKDGDVSSKQTFLPSPTGRENNNSPCK